MYLGHIYPDFHLPLPQDFPAHLPPNFMFFFRVYLSDPLSPISAVLRFMSAGKRNLTGTQLLVDLVALATTFSLFPRV